MQQVPSVVTEWQAVCEWMRQVAGWFLKGGVMSKDSLGESGLGLRGGHHRLGCTRYTRQQRPAIWAVLGVREAEARMLERDGQARERRAPEQR